MNGNQRMWRAAKLAALLLAAAPAARAQDGIYADFTTSMGGFTCKLDYGAAPKAVANFIRLAQGGYPWLDERTGAVRTNAFYDGVIFHRVIAGFMVQSGSPNQQGTDGPGYKFPDEFSSSLRFADAGGTLAMANSGTNSNGAQFFVTVGPASWLNDIHTIFGSVVGGMDAVLAIAGVETDLDPESARYQRPLADVTLQSVGIRRVGAAAQAFDVQAQELPVVSAQRVGIGVRTVEAETVVQLDFPREQYCNYKVFISTNLTDWNMADAGTEMSPPVVNGANLGAPAPEQPQQFYSLARVRYPTAAFVPWTVLGRSILMQFNDGNGYLLLGFDQAGGGAYSFNGTPGTIINYQWSGQQSVFYNYIGNLDYINYSGLIPMLLQYHFYNANDHSGTFTGTATNVNTHESFPVSGNFLFGNP